MGDVNENGIAGIVGDERASWICASEVLFRRPHPGSSLY